MRSYYTTLALQINEMRAAESEALRIEVFKLLDENKLLRAENARLKVRLAKTDTKAIVSKIRAV